MPNPLLAKLFSGAAGKLVETIGNTVDEFTTSDEERNDAKQKLTDAFVNYSLEIEKEVTERHKSDMTSDSWLSKNIRPMILIFALVQFTFFAVFDGNLGEFEVKDSYIQLLGTIISLGLAFYFGSRGFEKVQKIRNGIKSRKERRKDTE